LRKAIVDSLFAPDWTLEQGLTVVKQAGFDGIEFGLGKHPWFTLATTDRQVQDLGRRVQDMGLAVSNVSDGLLRKYPPTARDPVVRRQGLRVVERQLEAAHLLGAPSILVITGSVTESTAYNDLYERLRDALLELAPKAAALEIKLGVENGNCEDDFLLSPREFLTFLSEIRSPYVGIHLDLGNIHETGFAEQWIETLVERITCIHVKDVMKHRGHCEEVYTNLFLGDNNWKAIQVAIEKIHYSGWLVAEMEAQYSYAREQQFFDTSAAMSRLISGDL
jgi:L-ribulose-5-phosphate 3-epimerase